MNTKDRIEKMEKQVENLPLCAVCSKLAGLSSEERSARIDELLQKGFAGMPPEERRKRLEMLASA